jgi:hypothetical protein
VKIDAASCSWRQVTPDSSELYSDRRSMTKLSKDLLELEQNKSQEARTMS